MKELGKQRSVLVRPRLTVDNGEAIRDAAIAGLGLTVLPIFIVADALRAGTLLPVLRDTPVVSDGIFVVYPPDRHLSTKVRALIEHLTAAFKGRFGGRLDEQRPAALCSPPESPRAFRVNLSYQGPNLTVVYGGAVSSAPGVRRDKAALSSG